MGPRELADVMLPPFEMAMRDGGARSVMHSYTEIDGVPGRRRPGLLTGLLRDEWGFTGTVVADYFGDRASCRPCTASPATRGEAAALALRAGHRRRAAHRALLRRAAGRGRARRARSTEALVDRRAAPGAAPEGRARPARRRTGSALPRPTGVAATSTRREHRALARRLAEESVVLLPTTACCRCRRRRRVAAGRPARRRPDGDARLLLLPQPRRRPRTPELPLGIDDPHPARRAAAPSFPAPTRLARPGCDVDGDGRRPASTAAVARGRATPTCACSSLGDRAGLFGRGTSGEGCDAADLALPGVQAELVEAVLATGTPVVLVLLTGRPYALGPRRATGRPPSCRRSSPARRAARAIAGVLTGPGRTRPGGCR